MTRPFKHLQGGPLTREQLLEALRRLSPPNPTYAQNHAQGEDFLLRYVNDPEIAEAYDRIPKRYSADPEIVAALEVAEQRMARHVGHPINANPQQLAADFSEALAYVRAALAKVRP